MEYINFGKVVNVSASVPVAVNDTAYHIIIDFVPNCPEIFDSFHTDMGKILEWPDDYVLCNVSDIKELEDLGADLNEHIKNLERIKEFLINGNATLINENGKLKATNQALKDRIKELIFKLSDQKKNYDKKQAEQIEELEKDRDYWRDRFGSIVIDVSKKLEANGVEFTVKAIDGNKWNAIVDIPELNEAKKKVEDLEKKLAAAKSNETYWRDRKEEEEEFHHYWWHTYNLTVAHAANTGVRISMTGDDKENNVGVILVKNEKVEELEAKWSAMLQALKEKGVEVLYMGEEDGKPNIDIKIPEIGDLKKEPEKPEKSKYTCKDCDYYRALYGNYYTCKQTGCFCSTECDTPCDVFKKKESLDEDENVVYANNVKIDISSKGSRVYMTDGIVTSEELADRIRKLYLDGGIGFADAQIMLERLKQ